MRRPRRAEPRIDKKNPAGHPRRYVSMVVAAEYLEVDRKTLGVYLDAGLIPFQQFGCRRRMLLSDLLEFETCERKQSA